jgi:hypothetical protein
MKKQVLLAALLFTTACLWLGRELLRTPEHASETALAEAEHEPSTPRDPLVAPEGDVRRDMPLSPPPTTATPEASAEPPPSSAEPRPDDLRVQVIERETSRRLAELDVQIVRHLKTSEGTFTTDLGARRPTGNEPELRLPRREVLDPSKDPIGYELFSGVVGIFEPAVEQRVALDPWPTQPVELVVPPHGWVQFHVRDELGRDADVNGSIRVWCTPRGASLLQHSFPIERGRSAAIPCGLGLALEVHATLEGEFAAIRGVEATGPRSAGESVSIPLELPQRRAVLLVRVMLGADEPLRTSAVEIRHETTRVTAQSSMSLSRNDRGETDAEGWMHIPIEERVLNAGATRALVLVHPHAERGKLSAALDLSRELPPGESSLGEILLQEEPLLVSGSVVDDAGKPLARETVTAFIHAPASSGRTPRFETTATDAVGRFAFRGFGGATRIELQVRRPGYLTVEGFEVATGTRDLVIVLQKGASLRGSVKLPAGMDATLLRVELTPVAQPEQPRATPSAPIAKEPHHARFLTRDRTQLETIRDLRFDAGAENRDPRVQELELCRGWRALELRLLDESGAALRNAEIELLSIDSTSRRSLRCDADGACAAWIAPEEQRFRIEVPLHRPVTITWTGQRQDLRLRAGIRVTLPVQATLSAPITELRVALRRSDDKSTPWSVVRDGSAELVASEPGRYTLMVGILLREGSSTMMSQVELASPYVVEIAEDGPTSLPTCVIPEATLRAALGSK